MVMVVLSQHRPPGRSQRRKAGSSEPSHKAGNGGSVVIQDPDGGLWIQRGGLADLGRHQGGGMKT